MKLKKLIAAGLAVVMTGGLVPVNAAETKEGDTVLPYQNEALTFEERAADLVSRMTLEEKVSQLQNSASAISRLGVSKYNYWREGLHGVARQGQATSFPSPLSMSNTWDREIVKEAADITSTEARLKNSRTDLNYWSPTINMARDPRWGRNEETFGEDPYLTTQLGTKFIEGMQGNDPKYLKTIATLKHFIANNCEGERTSGSSVMDEQTLRDYYGKAFEDIIKAAAPGAVMSSYNATTVTRNGETIQKDGYLPWDYLPSPANPYILTDLLRRTWGFGGFVTGDCGAVNYLNSTAAYKKTLFPDAEVLGDIPQSSTVAKAFQAGNDLDCGSVANAGALEAIQNGELDENTVDIALYRAFLERMKTGEFDSSVPYRSINAKIEAPEHVAVAEKAAEESWVLLKNEDNILPLKDDVKNIAIVGSYAGQAFLGDYSGLPTDTTTPYQGLVEVFKNKANVEYIGAVGDDTPLFNIKSLKLVKNDNTEVNVDLSSASISVIDSKTNKTGVQKSGTSLVDFTPVGTASINNVDFTDVKSIKAEMSADALSPGGSLLIGYGSLSQTVSDIKVPLTGSKDTYETAEAVCTANAGGYSGKATLFLSASTVSEFKLEDNKDKLDAADVIIAYAGTNLSESSESNDREHITLPTDQAHVKAITDAYPDKTIVAMQTVGQMDISPFADKAKAILWTSYNGQKQGLAFAKIIAGDVNPSGKLTTTWYAPSDLEKLSLRSKEESSGGITWKRNTGYQIRQSADYPGRTYQYYNGKPVYPFGYGLSYTNYEYSNLKLSQNTIDANGSINVSVDVKNTGSADGSEVVQLYVKAPGGNGTDLPIKQLKGFERVDLKAGESKTVTMSLNIPALHFFSESDQKIYVPAGTYTIVVGKNSTDETNTAALTVTGSLKSELDKVVAVPTGVRVIGAVNADATHVDELMSVDANISAVMTDQTSVDLSTAEVSYESSDDNVAVVDALGHVKSGTKSGTATITATVTLGGVTKSTSFPVAVQTKAAITPETLKTYTDRLDAAYAAYKQSDYSETNWGLLEGIYNEAKKALEKEVDSDKLEPTTKNAIDGMANIRKKPAPGTQIYVIDEYKDSVSGSIVTKITYNGDSMEPSAVLIAAVYNADGSLNRVVNTDIGDSGEYSIAGSFVSGEKVELYIWKDLDTMEPLSDKHEHVFTISADAMVTVYNFSDPKFDPWRGSANDMPLQKIDIWDGYGSFNDKNAGNLTYEYGGTTYTFSKALQAGAGNETRRCIYFTPAPGFAKCTLTVIFDSSAADRPMYIKQGGKTLAEGAGPNNDKPKALSITAEITDFTQPVYIYGGSSNKNLLGAIVAYE